MIFSYSFIILLSYYLNIRYRRILIELIILFFSYLFYFDIIYRWIQLYNSNHFIDCDWLKEEEEENNNVDEYEDVLNEVSAMASGTGTGTGTGTGIDPVKSSVVCSPSTSEIGSVFGLRFDPQENKMTLQLTAVSSDARSPLSSAESAAPEANFPHKLQSSPMNCRYYYY